jgi:hypothetical protein
MYVFRRYPQFIKSYTLLPSRHTTKSQDHNVAECACHKPNKIVRRLGSALTCVNFPPLAIKTYLDKKCTEQQERIWKTENNFSTKRALRIKRVTNRNDKIVVFAHAMGTYQN